MTGSPGVRAALLVGSVELRRSWRRLAKPGPYRTPKLLLLAAFLLVYALAAGAAGLVAGTLLREGLGGVVDAGGDPTTVLAGARTVATGLLAMVAVFTVQRTVKGKGVPDGTALLLTTRSHRTVAAGLLLAETVRVLLVAGAPAFAFAGGVAAGLQRPTAFVPVAVAVLGVVVSGVAVGFAAGLAIKNVAARSRLIARHRLAANLLASSALLGGYLALSSDPAAVAGLVDRLGGNPIGWPADLALSRSPVPVAEGHVGLAAVGLLSLPLLATVATGRLAGWLWYADGTIDGTETPGPSADGGFLLDRIGRVGAALGAGRPVRSVATKCTRRLRRAPQTAQYALLPVFFLFYELQSLVFTGSVPPRLAPLVALAGAWGTGALFTLNPVGDEEPVLPVTLSTAVGGRALLAGRTVAGLAVGVPLTLLGVGAVAAVSPLSIAEGATVATAALALCVAAPALAAAAGVRFPKREATTVARGRELVVPSPWAFAAYSVLLVAVGAPLVVVHLDPATPLLASAPLDAATVRVAGAASTGLLALVLGAIGWRDATGRLDAYRLE